MKIAIIGAGISGISAGKMLQDSEHEVVLFEQSPQTGGLIKCTREQGILFHRVGGHVFNSKNQLVLDWFWRHFDREHEFIHAKRNAKIWLNGQTTGYPLENNLYHFGEQIVASAVKDILQINKTLPALNSFGSICAYFQTFDRFLQENFGQTLYQRYFKPYNEKIWKTALSNLPLAWLEGKLPMPRHQEMLTNNILRTGEQHMVHATFFYPKNNGSQFIIDRLAEGLNIRTNYRVHSITKTQQGCCINGHEKFDQVVFTGDVRLLPTILAGFNAKLNDIEQLPANGTTNVLCEIDPSDTSWLYLPDPQILPHRIIYTGNFSPSNNQNNKLSCTIEYSGYLSASEMEKAVAQLPGKPTVVAYNHEPNSYILHRFGTKERMAALKQDLATEGIHLLGRFAEWEYYNMDKCMERAMEVTQQIHP